MKFLCPLCLHELCKKCSELTMKEKIPLVRCCTCKSLDVQASWRSAGSRAKEKEKKSLSKKAVSILLWFLLQPVVANAIQQYQIQFNSTYIFSTSYQPHPEPIGYTNISVLQGSMNNLVTVVIPDSPLCIFGSCFYGVDLQVEIPYVTGKIDTVPCCIYREILFNSWPSTDDSFWTDPKLPAIPPDLMDLQLGEFVLRSSDIGLRGLTFGTYTVTEIPEPMSLILLGIGVLIVASLSKKFV